MFNLKKLLPPEVSGNLSYKKRRGSRLATILGEIPDHATQIPLLVLFLEFVFKKGSLSRSAMPFADGPKYAKTNSRCLKLELEFFRKNYFFPRAVSTSPMMSITAETITGVQLAVLTAISIPKTLKLSESSMACMPKIIVPTAPSIAKIIPNVFIAANVS